MSFREKSAWGMAALFGCAGVWYLSLSTPLVHPSPPVAAFVPFVALIVIASILLQIGLAVASPREAGARADERERPALDRAGHWSGMMLAGGVVTVLMVALVDPDERRLFHYLMLSLIVAQFGEYVFQIVLLRRGR